MPCLAPAGRSDGSRSPFAFLLCSSADPARLQWALHTSSKYKHVLFQMQYLEITFLVKWTQSFFFPLGILEKFQCVGGGKWSRGCKQELILSVGLNGERNWTGLGDSVIHLWVWKHWDDSVCWLIQEQAKWCELTAITELNWMSNIPHNKWCFVKIA